MSPLAPHAFLGMPSILLIPNARTHLAEGGEYCNQEQIRHNLYFNHFKFLCENSLSKSAF